MTAIKVAAHVHSEWSYDASWSLPALARSFRRRGFDAVLMSEHDQGFDQHRWRDYVRACAAASRPDLILIPGVEYSDADNVVHLPVWGDLPFLGSGHSSDDLLRRAAAAGGFTTFAHPWRRGAWQRFEESWLPNLSAVEIWNRKYDGWAPRGDAVEFAHRHALRPFVSLDFHTRRQFFPLGLQVEIDRAVTRASVEAALLQGSFRPLFFSVSALRCTEGVLSAALNALEAGRRMAAARLRR